MRSVTIGFAILLGACGSKTSGGGDTLPEDLRAGPADAGSPASELEARQGAACEALGPRLTACAIADARATMSPQELAELDIENTSRIHTREFVKSCNAQSMSSRQVRVYEVCMAEESECGALTACLGNASPTAPASP